MPNHVISSTESQHHTSTAHVGQVAVAGRDDSGAITLRLTPDAAEALAGVLARYDAVHSMFSPDYQAAQYDGDLWIHVGVDLLAQKALQPALRGPVRRADRVGRRDGPGAAHRPPAPRERLPPAPAPLPGRRDRPGRGPGMMMATDTRPPATQRVDEGRAAAAAGQAQVEQHADPRVMLTIDAAIERAIASGRRFSANSIRDQFPVSDEHLIGARVASFAKRRVDGHPLMVRVAYEPSTLKSTKGHDIKVWLGWDAYQALSNPNS
ncbi:hypothetical protein G5V59_00385 [Nocardioides sp. W3-2-3]|nr:hypothetical protein [Nocardioides convexus]